ncbi:MAG TPA: MaoC family dehydratase [Ramlibacter sp.]|nr:MaoC family dehydratase [Ramlibacter sp.]
MPSRREQCPRCCSATPYFNELLQQRELAGRSTLAAYIAWQGLGAIELDALLTLQAQVTGRWWRRGREYVEIEMTVLRADGSSAGRYRYAEAWSPASAEGLPVREGAADALRIADAAAPRWHTARRFTAAMIAAFAKDDPNLHNDAALAHAAGFEGTVLAGVQQFVLFGELCADGLGRGFLEHGALETRFVRPVVAGCTLLAEAVPDEGDSWRLRCSNNADGKVTAIGRASI